MHLYYLLAYTYLPGSLAKLLDGKYQRMRDILAHPDQYSSQPEGIMDELRAWLQRTDPQALDVYVAFGGPLWNPEAMPPGLPDYVRYFIGPNGSSFVVTAVPQPSRPQPSGPSTPPDLGVGASNVPSSAFRSCFCVLLYECVYFGWDSMSGLLVGIRRFPLQRQQLSGRGVKRGF